MNELIIGSHVSFKSKEQLIGSIKEALSYGANTFMFYTGAPQSTNRVPIDINKVKVAHQLMIDNNIDIKNVIVHAPYIINLANINNFDFNVRFLKEEIKRCELLGITKMVIHPGSHINQGVKIGINNIIDALNMSIDKNTNVKVLLETMAGKGSECGKSIDELKEIIDGIKYKDKIGICIDTCHINDAGYLLSNFDDFLLEIDEKIGIDKIGCIHINDSKNALDSHKDRHANIGYGTVGFDNLINVIYSDKLKDVPKILETPYINDYPPYKYEIDMIKNKKFNNNLIDDVVNSYK